MKDPRLTKLANGLLDYSTEIKQGEPILIEVYGEGIPLAKELIKGAYERGAFPFLKIVDEESARLLLEGTTPERSELQRKWDLSMWQDIKAAIRIFGLKNDKESANVRIEQKRIQQNAMKPVLDHIINKTRWVLLEYPTYSIAQKAGMSLEEFEDFYFKVCTLDYQKMDRAMDELKALMDKTDRVHIKGEGTDLHFSIKDLGAIKCSGLRNIPDGEVYTAPVKDSVNGVITFNTSTTYLGTKFDSVKFIFENGKIVKAASSITEALNRILDTDEGSRFIGEFAIGVNPHILHPMDDTLFDEKIAGSFHFTPGQSYKNESYNGNDSNIHWDIVNIQRPEYGGGEIWFDGVLIRKDGLFVPESLHPLNPENLLYSNQKTEEALV
ncbi:aminopeptidase [Peribacillus deserti]|uniref:Aminopeptidase n=1 Tax=Peribacillus deserti TaxID=673318 RepID=A0ABS2QGC1_9BACI|nr:aminopeptidase [Peribacillus deserti]MBM7692142.1 aminopeptidase [Peribacillus deserti]